ncbi:MAG TPA: response regulator [Gallionella sp.]|nr:response regulator [Gallionella sp.]
MSENVAVLLVDDRPENLLALEEVLRGPEIDLVKVSSGDAALRSTLRQDFALVLLDVQMPGMSGFEVAELMRANPKTRHLPIIFVTAGMNDVQLQFKGYELGAVDYLIKPFEPHILQGKVNVFCELYRQRRKAERTHQEKLFNAMREGFAHCRMLYENNQPVDFVYLEVNTAFEQLTGLKNVIGRRVTEVISGIRESNPELFTIYGRVAATGNPELFETYVEPVAKWLSLSVYSTEKEHFVTVFQDITERMKNEQELMVMNHQLAHEVTMRTADLSALTAHVQNIAETERATLARELHDELGSTLVGISMELGRLRGKISAPELLQDLSQIKDLLSNAAQITRSVVHQLYPTVLDNYGLVAAIEWQVNEFRKRTGVTVELITPGEPIEAEHTFALAAYRITQECLTNIAKHAGASKVHIEVKAGGGFLDLTIRDNGKGLPATTNTGGHGIFGMIERARYLGGSMDIGSETGMGTIARLSLPLETIRPQDKKRVLVVEDHAIVRDAIRHLLEKQTDDFSVGGEAGDGKVAVQMAMDEEWDIVLLDISLPKKDGLTVLERIKSAKPGLPVIMLSSHPESEYAEMAISRGAACYIEKGETDRLVEAMRRAILLQ